MSAKIEKKERAPRRRRKGLGTEKLPEFMVGDENLGKENMRPDLTVWIGDDGSVDPEKLALEDNFGIDPIRLLLSAIVVGNPGVKNSPRKTRIDAAHSALFSMKLRRGVDAYDDAILLREIGRRYFLRYFDNPFVIIDVQPIAREVIREWKQSSEKNPRVVEIGAGTNDSIETRLRRKFDARRDEILACVTSEVQQAEADLFTHLLIIIAELRKLGVQVSDEEILRLRRWGAKPHQ